MCCINQSTINQNCLSLEMCFGGNAVNPRDERCDVLKAEAVKQTDHHRQSCSSHSKSF